MSRRHSVVVNVKRDCDGGESPNAFVPLITAELRVYFPPYTVSRDEVRYAVEEAVTQALTKLEEREWRR